MHSSQAYPVKYTLVLPTCLETVPLIMCSRRDEQRGYCGTPHVQINPQLCIQVPIGYCNDHALQAIAAIQAKCKPYLVRK